MFTTILLICVPVLLIFIGTVAALSFAKDPTTPEATGARAATGDAPILAARPSAVLFKPHPRPSAERQPSAAELITVLEAHLRRERLAAQNFTRDPSTETLWVN